MGRFKCFGVGIKAHMLYGPMAETEMLIPVGKRIVKAEIVVDDMHKLRLDFEDGTAIVMYDDGQACCEQRYMSTDDDIQSLVGALLVRIDQCDTRYGDRSAEEILDCSFVEIGTDKGFITLVNYNSHNGYYGDFDLVIETIGAGE